MNEVPPFMIISKALLREQFYVCVAYVQHQFRRSPLSRLSCISMMAYNQTVISNVFLRLSLYITHVFLVLLNHTCYDPAHAVSRHSFLICITPGMHPPAPTTRSVRKPFSRLQCTVRGAHAMLMARLRLMASTSACSSALAAA